jgi:hypothetical protein
MKKYPEWMQRNLTWVKYDTMTEFVAHLKTLPVRENWNSWSGAGLSTEDTYQKALYGWPEATALAAKIAEQLSERIVSMSEISPVPQYNYDVMGGAFDAGSFISGVPECWGVTQPETVRRAVRIVANIDASGGVSNDVLIQRGAAVGALVMLLQLRGHPVTVDVLCPDGSYSKRGCMVRVASAESGSQLDIDKVVFALAHPGMLRVFFRGWTNEYIGGQRGRWDTTAPLTNEFPDGDIDLVLGGTHLYEFARYADGGVQWIIDEYMRQTADE